MQDSARLFAYSTWALMISLGIILFSHQFFRFMDESDWIDLIIIVAFGFLYFNLTFAVIKRYIRKVPVPTNSHFFLSLIIYLAPVAWIIVINDVFTRNELLLVLILTLAVISGTIYGNRAGIRARFEYIQKLKEYQKQMEKKN
jgi:hypothetical protein